MSPETAPTLYYPLQLRRPRKPTAPSALNREVFRQVKVFQRPQADVAREFNVRPQRVTAILKQVARWLDFTGGHEQPCDWHERLSVQEYVHRQRLEDLYGEFREGYKLACQERKTTKTVEVEGKPTRTETTFRQPWLSPRWLDLAEKTEVARMAFDERRGNIDPPAEEEESDAEKIQSTQDFAAEMYWNRPPEAEDFCDVREMRERLEKLQAQLEMQQQFLEQQREMFESTRATWYASLSQRKDPEVVIEDPVAPPPAVKMDVGETSEEVALACPLSTGKASGTRAAARSPRPTDIYLPMENHPYEWRYAEQDDFSASARRRKVAERLDEARRRRKFMVISHGPPLEVKPGIFVMVEPHPLEGRERTQFISEWQRREAEAAASADPWFPPRFKFDEKGKVVGVF